MTVFCPVHLSARSRGRKPFQLVHLHAQRSLSIESTGIQTPDSDQRKDSNGQFSSKFRVGVRRWVLVDNYTDRKTIPSDVSHMS